MNEDGTWSITTTTFTDFSLIILYSDTEDGQRYSGHVRLVTIAEGDDITLDECLVVPLIGTLPVLEAPTTITADILSFDIDPDKMDFNLGYDHALAGKRVDVDIMPKDAIDGMKPIAMWAFAVFGVRTEDEDQSIPLTIAADPDLVIPAGGPGATITFYELNQITAEYASVGTVTIDAEGAMTGDVALHRFSWLVAAVPE